MLMLSLLVACGSEPAAPTGGDAAPTSAPKTVVVKGSDSEVNVVQRLAEEFMKTNPGVRISVTGGGSGTGVAALMDGTTDLANSSRELKGEEKMRFLEKGVEPKPFVFATDGLAIVVNAGSPVDAISMDEVAGVFRGEITSWAALGGPDQPISLYGRQSNSGTYDYFKKAGVKGEYAPTLKQMNGNAQIVEGLASDVTGIGYVAAGYVAGKTGVKVLGIETAEGVVSPMDEAAVLAGRYPLARPLYQFTRGKPEGAVRDFLAFEASEAGQKVVKEMGFYPIFDSKKGENLALLE